MNLDFTRPTRLNEILCASLATLVRNGARPEFEIAGQRYEFEGSETYNRVTVRMWTPLEGCTANVCLDTGNTALDFERYERVATILCDPVRYRVYGNKRRMRRPR